MQLQTDGIDHVNIDVKDLEESVRFYCDLFGFRVLKEQPAEQSKIIGNEAVKLCLYEEKGLQLPEQDAPGFNHFGFHVNNFDDVLATCKEQNVDILFDEKVLEWERSESVYIKDPSGYVIELSRNFGGGLQAGQ